MMSLVLSSPGLGCPCQHSALGNLDSYIGKFVRSKQPVPKYSEPGMAAYFTVKPDGYIGKIAAFNSKGNWAKLTDGKWILFNNPSMYYIVQSNPLTPENEKIAEEVAWRNYVEGSIVGGKVITTGYDVGKGAIDVATSTLDAVGWVGKNLKWFLLAGAAIYGYKVYKDLKPSEK